MRNGILEEPTAAIFRVKLIRVKMQPSYIGTDTVCDISSHLSHFIFQSVYQIL
jgi:hypothetical protein